MAGKTRNQAGFNALTATLLTLLEEAGDLATRPTPAKPAHAVEQAARLQKLTGDAACLAAAMAILAAPKSSKTR